MPPISAEYYRIKPSVEKTTIFTPTTVTINSNNQPSNCLSFLENYSVKFTSNSTSYDICSKIGFPTSAQSYKDGATVIVT